MYSKTCSTLLLSMAHSDVFIKPQPTMGGSKCFESLIDGYTLYCWVYTNRQKRDLFETFKHRLAMVERQVPQNYLILGSDVGGENSSIEMSSNSRGRCILHQKAAPYYPHQNKVAERLSSTFGNFVRSLFQHRYLPNLLRSIR